MKTDITRRNNEIFHVGSTEDSDRYELSYWWISFPVYT